MKLLLMGFLTLASISSFAEEIVLKNCESKIIKEVFDSRTTDKSIQIITGISCVTNSLSCQQIQQRQQAESFQTEFKGQEFYQVLTINEGEVKRFGTDLYSCER